MSSTPTALSPIVEIAISKFESSREALDNLAKDKDTVDGEVVLKHAIKSIEDAEEKKKVSSAIAALEIAAKALEALGKPMTEYRDEYAEYRELNVAKARELHIRAAKGINALAENATDYGFTADDITALITAIAVDEELDGDEIDSADPYAEWVKRVRAWGIEKGLAHKQGQIKGTVKRLYVKLHPADPEPAKA